MPAKKNPEKSRDFHEFSVSKKKPVSHQFMHSTSPNLKLYEFVESREKDSMKIILKSSQNLSESFASIAKEVKNFYEFLKSITLINVILMWGELIEEDLVFGRLHIDIMKKLLENDIIQYKSHEGKCLTLDEYVHDGHESIINSIRCIKGWSVDKQEEAVSFYLEFVNWLHGITIGYVPKAEDPDRILTLRRKLPFEDYIKIIKELSLRERILVKLFYLGGTKSQDEVLSIKIEDINFSHCRLKIGDETFTYPKHVFSDLQDYLEGQKTGFVFTNKSGDKIDHTVPYRSFKTAISKLNMSLSFKDLMTNI